MRAKLLRRAAVQEKDINFQGLPVTIEWPKGSTRTGVGKDGKDWYRKMNADYGYVRDTRAKGDGEPLDVYIGPDKDAPDAYVIEQLKDDGSFDEPKVMLGFDSLATARDTYLEHYPAGWENTNMGGIFTVTVQRLTEMVEEADDSEQRMTDDLSNTDENRHEINKAEVSGASRIAGSVYLLGVVEPEDETVDHHFLTVAEVMETFYNEVLPKPGYQQALRELGGGKEYDELDQDTRNAICVRGHRLEEGLDHAE